MVVRTTYERTDFNRLTRLKWRLRDRKPPERDRHSFEIYARAPGGKRRTYFAGRAWMDAGGWIRTENGCWWPFGGAIPG